MALFICKKPWSLILNFWRQQCETRDESRSSHFLELLDVELNHGQIDRLNPDIIGKNLSFPDLFSEFLYGHKKREFDDLLNVFAMNSQQTVHTIFDTMPQLQRCLTSSSISKTHGPVVGLVYGALDIYGPYRIQEENDYWNATYEIPIR